MVDEYGNVIDNNGVNYSRVEMDSYSVIRECLQRAYNDAIKTYQETKADEQLNKEIAKKEKDQGKTEDDHSD